jgi:hypothetical protein
MCEDMQHLHIHPLLQVCVRPCLACLHLTFLPACLAALAWLCACWPTAAELEGLHREVLLRALQILEAQGKVK